MTEISNIERAGRIERILPHYLDAAGYLQPGPLDSSQLSDLVADVAHFCDAKGIEFDDVIKTARIHHEAEKNGREL